MEGGLVFPTRVLAAIDGSEAAEHAAREASRLCLRTNSELHVVHVTLASMPNVLAGAEAVGWWYTDEERLREIEERGERDGRELLEKQVAKISYAGVPVKGSHLKMGRVDASVADLAEELEAGLLVVGSRGHGALRRKLVGSVSDSLIHHAHCPVLVVRGDEGDPAASLFTGQILAGYDGSEISEEAVRAGIELAEALNSDLHVAAVTDMSKVIPYAHPYTQGGMGKEIQRAEAKTALMLDELLARLESKKANVDITPQLRTGQPAAELVGLAERLDAGITIVGSRGHGGIRRALLGSVSTSVTHYVHGSVLVYRPVADRDRA